MLDELRNLFLSALRGKEDPETLIRKWNDEIKCIQEVYDMTRYGEQLQSTQKKGHWIDGETSCICSECHIGCLVKSDYCPWCGADMRERHQDG